jgi:hypothetical protein
MAKMVRPFSKQDKILLAAALLNAGIKARIKMLNLGARVVFEGSEEAVAEVLNNEGFLFADGQKFGRFCFQRNQAFVRYVEM